MSALSTSETRETHPPAPRREGLALLAPGLYLTIKHGFEVLLSLLLCVPANTVGSYTAASFVTKNESLRPTLEWFSKRLTDGYSLADCLPNQRVVEWFLAQVKTDEADIGVRITGEFEAGVRFERRKFPGRRVSGVRRSRCASIIVGYKRRSLDLRH